MTLFIRNKRNESIVDCEIWNKEENDRTYTDISVVVSIDIYSELLLSQTDFKKIIDIIKVFSYIQELRGWLWESYYMSGGNDGEDLQDITIEIREFFQEICEDYDLIYVED